LGFYARHGAETCLVLLIVGACVALLTVGVCRFQKKLEIITREQLVNLLCVYLTTMIKVKHGKGVPEVLLPQEDLSLNRGRYKL